MAIARLTFKAAFRFRLVPVLAVLLMGGVLLLPAVIKDDGTAQGLTQIVLTYTLGLATALLGLTTLWLACGTLARDIEECQLQVVAVKPVARWQIWLGKWVGIMLLDALLLGLAAVIVYGQLMWRARSLPEAQRQALQNEILVARGSFREAPPEVEAEVERRLTERIKNPNVAAMDRSQVRRLLREQVKAELQSVPSGYFRRWTIDMGAVKDTLRDQPLFVRVKFFSSDQNSSRTYTGHWEVGPPDSTRRARTLRSHTAESFQEFTVPPNLVDDRGVLSIDFVNENDATLLFPVEDGLEVLYREGGFGLNYLRGVGIIFCWLALLGAIGLAAASFLAFPVAAFFSLGFLIVAFSTGTMKQVIEEGTIREVNHDTGRVDQATWFDHATVAGFKSVLTAVNLVRDFSPVSSLSTGRSVSWGQLARAIAQVVVLMGGVFAALGMAVLERRELATAQGKT